MKEDKTEFNILLVSDIHNQKDQLEKIVSKCKSVNYSPDYIISTGDHVTLSQGGKGDQEVIKAAEKEIELSQTFMDIRIKEKEWAKYLQLISLM